MTMLIAVPVYKVACKVVIDKARPWSVVDEVILWSIAREAKTIDALASDSNLPFRVIVASIARMMRFRLVEITITSGVAAFRASDYGFRIVSSGETLPYFSKTHSRRVSFVVERTAGGLFHTRDVRFMPPYKLDKESNNGIDVRRIVVMGGLPPMSHDANFDRLADVVARGWGEQIANIDGLSATIKDGFMVVRVVDGVCRDIPDAANTTLRQVISDTASQEKGNGHFSVAYSGGVEEVGPACSGIPCAFDPNDLIIGGSAQRSCLLSLLAGANRRVIIHSTFLDPVRFSALFDHIRSACLRGVTVDILWGAEHDEGTESRNAKAACEIMSIVRQDKDTYSKVRVHMNSTGSHAKFILADTDDDLWIAAIGSCNWLSSPFNAIELSVVLRDPLVVADVAGAVQRLVGRRGLADNIATEMAIVARELRKRVVVGRDATIAVVLGEAHEMLMRKASGAAKQRLVVGSNKLGSTARPGALMPSEVAAGRAGVTATVLYAQPSGPLKNRHAQALAEEAIANGVRLIKTETTRLHGKFIAWDDDNLVVTSLNWASASGDSDFPWGEIGVHIQAPNIATKAITELQSIFPEMLK